MSPYLLLLALAAQPSEATREEEMFGAEARGAPAKPAPAEAPSRDAEIFGPAESSPAQVSPSQPADSISPTEPSSPSPTAAPAGRDGEVLEGEGRTDAEARARLDEAYDSLAIGGLLYLRAEYAALERGAPETFALSTPNLLDLYLDARPSDRVRAYVRTRAYYDPTIEEGSLDAFGRERERTRILLDQLWVKTDVLETVYVTAGQQRIKWGTGRFWNPTDFANQARLDPLAVLDERTGVPLLKLDVPVESLGWNFYALGLFENATAPDQVGGAARAEIVVGEMETSLSAALRKDNPLRLGADVSFALWDFDVRGEVAVQHGVTKPFFRGDLDPATLTLPEAYSREDDWIPQAVVGLELPILYSDQDSVILGAEYFFNDAGYASADLYPWLILGGSLPFPIDGESPDPAAVDASAQQQALFEPLYNGRHYGAAYVLLQAPGTWDDTTFVLSTIGNLSDRSFLTRFDYRVLFLQYLRFDAHVAAHYGENGELHYGLDIPAVPGAPPPLGTGISTAPPFLDLGVGLAMDL